MKERLFSLDALRTFALFLLFAYHSNLNKIFPYPLWLVQTFLLTAFFMISGILFERSRKKYSFEEFAKNKFFRLYVPFIIILIFVYFLSSYTQYNIDKTAVLYHATLLSVFHILQDGVLNLFHLWYIVHLLIYYFLFFFLFKYVKSDKKIFFSVSALFFLLVFLWASNSPLRLEWKFFFFIWAFYIGCLIGKEERIKKLYEFSSIKWLLIFTVVSIITVFNSYYIEGTGLVKEFFNATIYIITNAAFGIALCLLTLSLLSRIKKNIAERVVFFISYGSVFIYLLQPIISNAVSCIFLPHCSAWSLNLYQTIIMIPISFSISVITGYIIQRAYDSALKKI